MTLLHTVITGTGSYIPELVKTNRDFAAHDFYDEFHGHINQPPALVAEKFKQITGIEERRYAPCDMNSSDLAVLAAKEAIEDAGIDPETIDQIIVAHNFGNVVKHSIQTDAVPSLASRVKHSLGIRNPACVPYDLLFGCPGWLQGVIQADAFIKAGIAKRCLVIGTETLSRVIDVYDRDSMIFSDGAGACIIDAVDSDKTNSGILASSVVSHCIDEAYYIYIGKGNFPGSDPRVRYIKMKGRKVFEYAMRHVPSAMKACLDKAGVDIHEVKKIFLHQANEKMDEGFTKELYKLYGIKEIPPHIMPMSIHKLGNSSVATIPTLYDLVKKGKMGEEHGIEPGDVVLFASVGAGMNINAVCYRV
ncbi:3-oxoacyl-ACP synthase III family protein [Solitalea canadensis]|uniref:3-oxoacyl-(Acyl-carrier-protein) synthase III n=1 Tax=Solitalea canadensis (strain ATCC 29591 / DSM 3403 / JCM 21819 / LMG 8368 / NBRC 15130 / NCIMB 12057 / USAM 9D) TaxID=929556 RepID=H8KTV9_SOLCM|nr:ketoacyl-ACP synthase III [Solitalea canadensis]AFD06809.1 3-oxoacyl-(acyl-carrier-protein) synthase III [Solitalea canadensis DSM 3403]